MTKEVFLLETRQNLENKPTSKLNSFINKILGVKVVPTADHSLSLKTISRTRTSLLRVETFLGQKARENNVSEGDQKKFTVISSKFDELQHIADGLWDDIKSNPKAAGRALKTVITADSPVNQVKNTVIDDLIRPAVKILNDNEFKNEAMASTSRIFRKELIRNIDHLKRDIDISANKKL
jgi:hypothetical protein